MEIKDRRNLVVFIGGKRWFDANDSKRKFGRGLASVMLGMGWSYLRTGDGRTIWFNPSLISQEELDNEIQHHL